MPGRPFKSGNTAAVGHGRPKGSSRILTCKEFAEKEGFQRLIEIARGESYRVVRNGKEVTLDPSLDLIFESIKLLLAYGIGKPAQVHEISADVNSIADWIQQFTKSDYSAPSLIEGSGGSDQLRSIS